MRLIFAGTPEFAQHALSALHAAGHDIALVLTQPDRPAGRGMQLQASAVKQLALAHQWPVAQPRSLRLEGKYPEDAHAAQAAIAQAQAQAMVVAAYGLILPQWVLSATPLGGLNIHASLLPRWRGAAPIHRAIEAGDAQTGVCIMQMDTGLDTGGVLLRRKLPIEADDTTARLHDRLASLGAKAMIDVLAMPPPWQAEPQSDQGITYAAKIEKAEAQIDWAQAAVVLARRIRAFDPFPGAHTVWQGQTLKLWSAMALDTPASAPPGQVVQASPQGLEVATGDGVLRVLQLQKPGGKRLGVADFLRGSDTDWRAQTLGL
ncbi:MAG: methionyl-tRNA formyltransferase [Betaproteobacteria bacterium]|nr:methionyl-tRNA formyltransferase [Betaproteobacteria bacterium]NBY05461.1 methionyl-tRNA formyltransferase [Betaproteobacteria bacterium]